MMRVETGRVPTVCGGFTDEEANELYRSGEWSVPEWSEKRQAWMMRRLRGAGQ